MYLHKGRVSARTQATHFLGGYLFSGGYPSTGEEAMDPVHASDGLVEHEGAGAINDGDVVVTADLHRFRRDRAFARPTVQPDASDTPFDGLTHHSGVALCQVTLCELHYISPGTCGHRVTNGRDADGIPTRYLGPAYAPARHES